MYIAMYWDGKFAEEILMAELAETLTLAFTSLRPFCCLHDLLNLYGPDAIAGRHLTINSIASCLLL